MPRKYIRKRLNKKYNEKDMKIAVEAVSKGLHVRESSNMFHIPYTTLNRHVNNDFVYDRSGRPTKFTTEEELCLEESALALQARDDFFCTLRLISSFFFEAMGHSVIYRRFYQSY